MNSQTRLAECFESARTKHLAAIVALREQQTGLEATAIAMTAPLRVGGYILWCGNGGSAAGSQHLAAERPGLPSLSRTEASVLASVANDYGHESVFSSRSGWRAGPRAGGHFHLGKQPKLMERIDNSFETIGRAQ